MSEIQFPEGIRAFDPNDGAPDYVLLNVSIDTKSLIEWLQAQGDKVRLTALRSANSGKPYFKVDTYEPKPQTAQNKPEPVQEPQPAGTIEESDLPF